MYLTIDVGGTKTLIASFDNTGQIINKIKFETPLEYRDFLTILADNILKLGEINYEYVGAAFPEMINQADNTLVAGGTLQWHNVNPKKDINNITNCPVLIDNDANLAGLSEAIIIKDHFSRVLYLTISTGIGGALIINQKIDQTLINMEPGHMILNHDNKAMIWEAFASGKAIVSTFNKYARDIDDKDSWIKIADNISQGIIALLPIIQPEVIVIGGSIGTYFEKYGQYLNQKVQDITDALILKPEIIKADHPEEAVIYGCYQLIKQATSLTN